MGAVDACAERFSATDGCCCIDSTKCAFPWAFTVLAAAGCGVKHNIDEEEEEEKAYEAISRERSSTAHKKEICGVKKNAKRN